MVIITNYNRPAIPSSSITRRRLKSKAAVSS